MQFGRLIPPTELTNEEYHKANGISASALKTASKDVKLYFKKHLLKRIPSSALDIGTAVHEGLLEPDKFNFTNYNFTPKDKEKVEILINNGKVMFDYILSKTLNEVSLFVKDDGFIRKVRADAYDPVNGIIYDVKTSKYNNINDFQNDAYKLKYTDQCAFYLDTFRMAGLKADYFAFLVIPTVSPSEPFGMVADNFFIEDGRESYNNTLLKIQEYSKLNEPIYFHNLSIPEWKKKQKGLIE